MRSSFLKSAGLLFSGSMVAQLIGFLITPVLTRIYSPEQFGAVILFTSFIAVFMVFSGLRFEMAIVIEDDDKKAATLTQLAVLLNIGFGILFTILVLFLHDPIASFFKLSSAPWLYAVAPVFAISGCLESLILWRNRSQEYGKISANRVISSSVAAGYKTAHPFLNLFGGNGLIIGHIIGQGLGLLHLARKSTIQWLKIDFQALKAVFLAYKQFPLFSAPAALINTVAIQMPAFMISAFDGEAATGFFGNAYKLTYLPMSLLAMAVAQVFYERIARLKDDKEASAEISHQLFNFLALVGIIPVVVVAVWGDVIIPFILGAEWETSGLFAQILILFYFSMFLTSPFSGAFEAYNKLKQQLVYNIAFLVMTTGGMFLSYRMGYDTLFALSIFAAIGFVLRFGILNYFFYLFGKNLIFKSILVILTSIGGILILQYIRNP